MEGVDGLNLRVNNLVFHKISGEKRGRVLIAMPATEHVFERTKGDVATTTTVATHFLETYNIRLQYPNLPCLENKKGQAYPMEVLRLKAGQRYKKLLNADQLQALGPSTALQ
eukprot:gene33178-42447_t